MSIKQHPVVVLVNGPKSNSNFLFKMYTVIRVDVTAGCHSSMMFAGALIQILNSRTAIASSQPCLSNWHFANSDKPATHKINLSQA